LDFAGAGYKIKAKIISTLPRNKITRSFAAQTDFIPLFQSVIISLRFSFDVRSDCVTV
jgi:hypothetical protein